uniref:Uncharacterized protein n=1 Tax=Siphoviridae sp. ctHip2 TaxID=2827830 RepID=A0A8S5RVS9_9CAUD|nr:MAG TPA: hypothetical protein [Siphoviridae sp. ctHip2]
MKKYTKKIIIGLLASTALFGSVAYSEEIQTVAVDTLNFVTNTKVATEEDVIKAKDTINELNLTKEYKESTKDSIKVRMPEDEVYNIVKTAKTESENNSKVENNKASELVDKYNSSKTEYNYRTAKDYIATIFDSSEQKTLLEKLDKSYKDEQKRIEEEKKKQEEAEAQARRNNIQFGSNGLLVEHSSDNAERVITLLLAIPNHKNGSAYHAQIDPIIDQLSAAEAVHVIHRIEGAGFGQTADGLAGVDSPATHRAFVERQVNGRREFGGSIHQLLKLWGTFDYGGY